MLTVILSVVKMQSVAVISFLTLLSLSLLISEV